MLTFGGDPKEYETISVKHDPAYTIMLHAIDITKEFIRRNGLILYGGSAIDYALRLRGDKIYPDDAIPDLDFYSPDNVKHAYDLADELYAAGYSEARAINALHVETMRVDVQDNHWVADISYRARANFDKLPYLEFNGLKIIHPLFQRIDLHNSFSFPYTDPPREVIFARCAKDIARFNLIDKHYPAAAALAAPIQDETPSSTLSLVKPLTIDLALKRYVFVGDAAYLLYCELHKKISAQGAQDKADEDIVGGFKCDVAAKTITFDTTARIVEIVHFDPKQVVTDVELRQVKKYRRHSSLLPPRVEGLSRDGLYNVVIYDMRGCLIAINTITLECGDESIPFRVCNIQYLMRFYLSLYFASEDPASREAAMAKYQSLLDMAKENAGGDRRSTGRSEGAFGPSIITYGSDNISLSKKIALNRIQVVLGEETPIKTPPNYYPAKNAEHKRGRPEYNIAEEEMFMESGEPLL